MAGACSLIDENMANIKLITSQKTLAKSMFPTGQRQE
jgi:hypothetical protein